MGAAGATSYQDIGTLEGGSGNDTFNLSGNIAIPPINAGVGTNTLTFLAGWTMPATIDLDVETGFQVINGPPSLDNFLIGSNLVIRQIFARLFPVKVLLSPGGPLIT